MRTYEYRHIVSFEDTNLVGNVYYANHIRWQGRCREMFLRDHAPNVLAELKKDLAMVTISVSCEYLGEIFAFDEIIIQMRLLSMIQNRIMMQFEYWRKNGEHETLVARGEQQVACMRRNNDRLLPIPIPTALATALSPYKKD